MEDRTVVLTGVSGLLGSVLAERMARDGLSLVLAGPRQGMVDGLAGRLRRDGTRAIGVASELGSPAEARAVAVRAADAFGEIDIWINCVGPQFIARFGNLDETAEAERLIGLGLIGSMHGSRQAVEIFRRQRRGVLINLCGMPTDDLCLGPVCSATRTGLFAVGDILRQEVGGAGMWDVHVCSVLAHLSDDGSAAPACLIDIAERVRGLIEHPHDDVDILCPPVSERSKSPARSMADCAGRRAWETRRTWWLGGMPCVETGTEVAG